MAIFMAFVESEKRDRPPPVPAFQQPLEYEKGGKQMQRRATAVWRGDLKSGTGKVSSDSGVLSDTAYSFRTRFENEKGTNPEELIAAAHAGCFAMALSAQLGEAGLKADEIAAQATVTLEKADGGWTVTKSHL